MKKLFYVILLSVCVLSLYGQSNYYTRYVNPLVGTAFHGHTYPGAIVPFGAVQLSPDTRLEGWDGCSAYHYSDSVVYGFSHTHLSGTGCSEYGDVLLMPVFKQASVINTEYCSSFLHSTEKAEPGYYSVLLDKYSIIVELTCTAHVGVHRYTFPRESGLKAVVIDLKHRDMVLNSALQYDKKENKIRGLRDSKAWNENQKLNFSIAFSQPVDHIEYYQNDQLVNAESGISGTNCKAIVYFAETTRELVAKVALSYAGFDLNDADKNMVEVADFDFDRVRREASETWNKELGKFNAETNDQELKKVFYTALYHCFTSPYLFSDVDGKYRGMDGLVYNAKDHNIYTVFSLWDTYRALHPLLTLVDSKRTGDFVYTFRKQYEQGGMLPVWELSAFETWCMIGYHSIPVIYEAYQKGILNSYSDYEKYQLLEAMVASAKLPKLGRAEYAQYGFIPAEMEHESVSKTLEYAYDDWCIAQYAKAIGKDDVYQEFIKRSQYYKNLMDPNGFMHAKMNGGYLQPFDPTEVNNHYTEANCWQYSTYVPHDFSTYIDLLGGTATAERFLDSLFGASSNMTGRNQADVTGLIGQYAHGNEPSHHAAYLYNYVGSPWKSQKLVNQIMYNLYTSAPDGLCGNEDCGQMSAWYVFSALGFYPVCPGDNKYIIGSPLFDKMTVKLGNGAELVVIAKNRSKEACYIQSVKLNGKSYNKSYILYDDIKNGAVLEFVMGTKPNTKWGVGKGKQAESRIAPSITMAPIINAESKSFTDSMTFSISLFDAASKDKAHSKAKGLYPAKMDKIYVSVKEKGKEVSEENAKKQLYTGPITIKKSSDIEAVSYNSKTGYSLPVRASFYQFVQDKTIKLQSEYETMYPAGGDNALIDGIRGAINFRLGGWQGYCGHDFKATVDLLEEKEISSVAAGFLQDSRSWIIYPVSMTVEISDDGVNFQHYGTYMNDVPANTEVSQMRDFKVEKKAMARYVRITAKTYGVLPEWHIGAGGNSHIFIDEITIE